jgi:predicted O-methyltransferase YrrM
MSTILTAFPAGHFYSPVVDPGELVPSRIWPVDPHVLGIDFNNASHVEILADHFPRYHPLYDYAETGEETPDLRQFFTGNSQFSWLDSRALFVLLHAWRPRRIIEVGSGFSSLLMADVNRRWFGGEIDIACIEPFPRAFLKTGVDGISRLIEAKVQDVELDEFARLRDGDVLFIDSSHVAKTGSDVNFLVFEVLPRLARGVLIHVHDVFLPHDYVKEWVIDENRSWNEQYVLRALLMHSTAFRVIFGSSYAFHAHRALVIAALALPNGRCFSGSSLWIRRT